MAKIQVINCVAKTGEKTKEFWVSKGLVVEDCQKKLVYPFLAGMDETATGTAMKNAFHQAVSTCVSILSEKITDKAILDVWLNALDKLDARITGKGGLLFGKTIQADAIRELSGLEFPQAEKAITAGDDETEAVTVDL